MINRLPVLYAVIVLVLVEVGAALAIFLSGVPAGSKIEDVSIITGMMASVIGVLLLLLQQSHVVDQVRETKQLMNGHLSEHRGHTDEQVRAIADAAAREVMAASSVVPAEPADRG